MIYNYTKNQAFKQQTYKKCLECRILEEENPIALDLTKNFRIH